MNIINGYELLSELKNDNSGYAKWGFAKKDKKTYFIKEFLTPIYPLDGTVLSKEQIMRKRAICDEFESKKRAFYNVLNECSTGNIVTISDFFRYENKYYITTEKIDAAPLQPNDVASMELEQKLLITKIILHCVNSLHKHNIVHGDIKPDNILFKKTNSGIYTAKLVDFDSSFLISDALKDEELQGDMVYLAPESFLLMAENEMILTAKIDVFALGILFHQYFSGELPGFDKSQYDYVFEAVLDEHPLTISECVPSFFRDTISQMLNIHPARRPTVTDIFNTIVTNSASKPKTTEPIIETNVGETDSEKSTSLSSASSKLKSTMRTAVPNTEKTLGNEFFKVPDDLL